MPFFDQQFNIFPFFFVIICSILDDIEMYEQQTPFQMTDYIGLSYFLNNFLYKAIQANSFGKMIFQFICYI